MAYYNVAVAALLFFWKSNAEPLVLVPFANWKVPRSDSILGRIPLDLLTKEVHREERDLAIVRFVVPNGSEAVLDDETAHPTTK